MLTAFAFVFATFLLGEGQALRSSPSRKEWQAEETLEEVIVTMLKNEDDTHWQAGDHNSKVSGSKHNGDIDGEEDVGGENVEVAEKADETQGGHDMVDNSYVRMLV